MWRHKEYWLLVNYKKDRNIVFLVSRVIVYFYSAGVLTCIVIGSSVIIVYLYICSVSKVIKLYIISQLWREASLLRVRNWVWSGYKEDPGVGGIVLVITSSWKGANSITLAKINADIFGFCVLRTIIFNHQLMMSLLNTCQVCSPAEDLLSSQGRCHLAHRARKRERTLTWRVGTWNVRAMVDTDGPVEVASAKADGQRWTEEGGLNCGQDEEIWREGGCFTRGKVVWVWGIARTERGRGSHHGVWPSSGWWKRAGNQWKAWSSMIVSACLLMGKGCGGRLHVLSCYAPTRAARREVKDAFLQELDHMLVSVPSGEKYVVLGDFNHHVGSREHVRDQCDAVRGRHGMESSMMQERSCYSSFQYIRQQC